MFKSLTARNFQSWADLKFNFENGITLIDGQNHDDGRAEGSGKSAVANALCWGIYGKIPKEAKIDDVITYGKKECSVTVELDNGFKIVRHRARKNELYIEKDDVKYQEKDSKETQKKIESIIGLSFLSFVQTVYFPQDYAKKFMTASEEEKAQILSEIQNLGQFDKARAEAKAKIKELKSDLVKAEKEQHYLNATVTDQAGQLVSLERMKDNFEIEKNQRVIEITREVEGLQEEAETLKYSVNDKAQLDLDESLKEIAEKKDAIGKDRQEIAIKLASAAKDNALLKELDRGLNEKQKRAKQITLELETMQDHECPTCGQEVEDLKTFRLHSTKLIKEQREVESYIDGIQEKRNNLDKINVEHLQREQEKAEDRFKSAVTRQHELIDKLQEVREHSFKYKQISKQITKLQLDQTKEESRTPDEISKNIEFVSAKHKRDQELLTSIDSKIDGLKANMAELTVLEQGFKEVKSYVFRGALDELNQKVNQYASELFDTNVKISIRNNDDKGELSKIVIDCELDGKSLPIGVYSGGQTRRIQLAIDLALSDLVQSRAKVPISLKIFDEAMKNLSEESMQKVLELLSTQKGCILLIEHNSIFKSAVDRTFNVEYKDGKSTTKR